METLKNKVVIVTGSTSGMGLEMARRFAANGCRVVINGFAPEGVPERLCRDIGETNGGQVLYSGADLSKPEEIRDMVALAKDAFGTVDILINNAGLQHVAPVQDFPDDRWDMLIAVMLSAQFHAIKAVVPLMLSQKWGRIINIASANGLVAQPNKAAYVSAKHGVVGLTKGIALEVAASGITCNAICPGLVMTDLIRKQLANHAKLLNVSEDEALQKVFLGKTPTGRAVEPREIAGTALFLCSEDARSITGTTISVDGGYTTQ